MRRNSGTRTLSGLLRLFALLLAALPAHAALPSFDSVRTTHAVSEAWLLDREGVVLQTVRADDHVRRLPWVPLQALSPALVSALIVSEDRRFMQHTGVDWRAMVAAMWDTLGGERRGASTLTMQLAGMLDPALARAPGGRSLTQKWDQIGAARALEKTWTKQQILETYLNLAHFRGELAGIAAASSGLFGKHPSGLNKAESSILAALLRGPNAGADVVARRACGVAAELEAPRPDCKRIRHLARLSLRRSPQIGMARQLAPHLARSLALKPGEARKTTLDADIQAFAVESLGQHLAQLRAHAVEDGAVLVLDNTSGEIVAYVGSSASTSSAAAVDAVTAPRLPGSTLKPFLYALAIERRLLTAASPLEDSPLALDTPTGLYVPQNYERDFKGWVSLRSALGASLNVPAVRTLLLVGETRFFQHLKALGFATLAHDADHYGYALALGGGETTLLELGNAFRTLANGGVAGAVTHQPGAARIPDKRIMSAQTAFIISDILADKSARALTFGLASPLETNGFAAVKTGTSKDMRDNWCIGYSSRYTVGVWVGNASGAPMHDVSGITGAAPVWRAVMNRLHARSPSRAPKAPAGLEQRRIHFTPPIEPERREYFLAGTGQDEIRFVTPGERVLRIDGPANGAVLALDPDIPPAHQKVRFRLSAAHPGIHWRINAKPVDADWLDADGSLLWPPAKGAHRVSLHDAGGAELDAVFLTVR